MSEKRFHQFGLWVIDNPNFNGISIADLVDTELMSITEVVDKLNAFHEENEQLRLELETHKHPLWSTREAESKVNELADNLADEVKKNGLLNEELNQLRIENMRLKKRW